MYYVETKGLTHKFAGNPPILSNINLQVPHNSIYGFLGANGAGKTTTLKLILGLLKKQQGEVFVFDTPFAKNRIEILKNIGSLIETASLYSHLTAAENLAVLQKIYRFPKTRIAEVLDIVGLASTGSKKAGKFSLGMKQRLGIAIAILHNPKLLILDEPTNGLDPGGIIEIRELLKALHKQYGMTIIISSHLLSEIEKLVTHVGIINAGNLVFQGTLPELVDKQNSASIVTVYTNLLPQALQVIHQYDTQAKIAKEKIIFRYTDKEKIAQIARQLVQQNIDVYEITVGAENNLESVFMSLTKN